MAHKKADLRLEKEEKQPSMYSTAGICLQFQIIIWLHDKKGPVNTSVRCTAHRVLFRRTQMKLKFT